jgi:hypothetical protein
MSDIRRRASRCSTERLSLDRSRRAHSLASVGGLSLPAMAISNLVNSVEIVAHRSFLIPDDSEVLPTGNVPPPDRI